MSGVTPSYVSLLEAGKRKPSTASIEKIGNALGVPLHLLMLLAAGPGNLRERPRREVEQLAGLLLQILVSQQSSEECR